jgi:hypothetical protein
VTGRSQGNGTGYDYATIKYSRYGQEMWVKRYDGPAGGDDDAASIFVNSGGDIFVTGRSVATGTGYDYATIKYDWFGNEVWVARYNGPADSNDEAVSVVVDGPGNVFVTGTSQGLGSGSDIVTVKYDDLGNEDWTQSYDGPPSGEDEASSLTLTASGDVAVTGTSEGTDSAEDYVTIRYGASSGAEEWAARYDGPASGEDVAASVTRDGSGNVIVTGHSSGTKTGPDFATVKYDAGGSEVWATRFENPGMGGSYEVPAAMALDPSGNVCVTGSSASVSRYGALSPFDYATVKIDPQGNELWAALYDGPDGLRGRPNRVVGDAGGNVYVTGYSEGVGTEEDYLTIKYDPAGSELWVARYNGPGNDNDGARDLALDAAGNVYVTGYSAGSGMTTIKYDALGNELWVARYNFPASWVSIDVDVSGNVSIAGSVSTTVATITYDPDGNELRAWTANYPASPDEFVDISTVKVDASGSTYIAGSVSEYDDIYYDCTRSEYLVVKYDALGNLDWEIFYDGPFLWEEGQDEAVALVLDDTGGIYVTGYSESWGTDYDFATIKYSRDLTCNDTDGDGYGSPGSPGCTYPERDCDDTDPGVNPGDLENDWQECHNGIDDNCDGIVDRCHYCTWFAGNLVCPCDDSDGDGYGEGEPDELGGCGRPGEDCDDTRPAVNPGASEVPLNGIDDDCDGQVDEVACFIATVAFGSEFEGRIEVLRTFRNGVLMRIPAGRAFVETYYEVSPPVADFIAGRRWLRVLVRTLLLPLIGAVSLLV